MRRTFLLLLLLPLTLVAQFNDSKTDQRLIKDARASFEAGDYVSAALLYDSLLTFYPENAEFHYFAGMSRFSLRTRHSQALPALELSANKGYERSYLPLAILHHERGNLDAAESFYSKATEAGIEDQEALLSRRKMQFENAVKAKNQPQNIGLFRLGDAINSPFIDHTPFISFNDSLLIFTSRRPVNSKSVRDDNGEYDENIYISRRSASGWGEAQPLPGNVNGRLNDAAAGLYPDEEAMVIFKTARNLESSDLWMAAHDQEKGWKLVKKLEPPLNSNFIQSGTALASDGTFILASDRPGGYGGMDLYRVVRFGNGDYSEPVNLGPEINTAADERSPYFLADGKTLYFSSNRGESIGGFDIFSSHWVQSEKRWSKPQNIGYPLNSFRDDLHLSVSPKGGVCYFARSDMDNAGDYDIYRANLPGFNMEANIIRGELVDAASGQTIDEAELTLFSDDFAEIKGVYPCRYGRFFIVLLPGETGILEVTSDGYEPFEQAIDYEEHEGIWELKKRIELTESKE